MDNQLKIVSYKDCDDDEIVLIDLDTVPPRQRMDYARRNENIKSGKKLCDECGGTGNYFLFMYKACPECAGTGIANG